LLRAVVAHGGGWVGPAGGDLLVTEVDKSSFVLSEAFLTFADRSLLLACGAKGIDWQRVGSIPVMLSLNPRRVGQVEKPLWAQWVRPTC
jgi:hypothetical protein